MFLDGELRTCIYTYNPTSKSTTGFGPYDAPLYNPVCRYTR